ncbi:uncharacterized protein LOC123505595 isoform X1 [Portunus trituberculatus]|uniref:uncharacterized protein LOC123505595 isoform X1 n=1 Tax=Portunus trituberculatus TaxID=210409 RepID=UPI001E1CC972|nr:uncharacterized protein LOC123505595 isoform X1 [Portunus trituberculatus]
MPVDPAHHRLLHGRGARPLPRYTPLPSTEDRPPSLPLYSEVRLGMGGRPAVHVRAPVPRPCHRLRGPAAHTGPGHGTRYTKLTPVREEPPSLAGGGPGLLRAVASRGRGYEDLRCRGAGGDAPDSGGSSPLSSPRVSPRGSPAPPRRKTSGILITSALARSGLRRLTRVSFGSSKGSMVETLIYDSPVGEEERIPEEEDTQVTSPSAFKDPVSQKFGTETGAQQKPASKVRVTFYESSRPLVVTSPEPSDLDLYSPDLLMASPPADPAMPGFDRQLSTESGRDNPFRPGGDISKEADQIVEAIKSGRPLLTPDTTDTPTAPTPTTDAQIIPTQAPTSLQAQSPPESPISKGGNAGVNGSTPAEAPQSNSGTVEVKHVTVTPSDQGHVERVVIKKKNKCSCCVIQ